VNESAGGAGRAPARAEERVFFQGDYRLEGMLGWPAVEESGPAAAVGPLAGRVRRSVTGVIRGGVVVAHPYPPHGATMDLPVVYRIARSCRQRQLATLRFNFRSVGDSQGSFSGTEEHLDVQAAVSYLSGELAAMGGELPLGLAGYSFGSVMAARAVADLPVVKALVLIGFGVRWEHLPADTLERLALYQGPVLAVCAENDDLGPPDEVEKALKELDLDLSLQVIRGADHFLKGRHHEVGELVAGFFKEVLER
jgi:alpha/beta superfamily hydrolase